MEVTIKEEARVEIKIWNYVFGYAKIAAVKCAIELGIADVIENYGSPMPLSELATALRCDPSRLHRIMRLMVHDQIFKQEPINQHTVGFSSTPLSRCLIKGGEKSMAAFILLMSGPTCLAPWHSLSARVLETGNNISPFEVANGKDIWSYAEANPDFSELFNNAMGCKARLTVQATIEGCPEVFDGVENLVDIGGGNATALSILVKAFPWIRGINFDLPHVVAVAPKSDSIENVGGDMFMSIPNADAAFLMTVLHDWDDEECVKILKKCREAIPEDKGKVIIVEAVLEEDKEVDEVGVVGLMLDTAMMAITNKGKERTLKEWSYVLRQSGFTRFNVKPIRAVQSVIEAYP
ncbi:acetylserotonin O-methyltransferase-like [Gossypium arboreum]|uniref:acetylserotonin O-methyltransferase-like n=1 Tax=Gossypium arboreum TaxID=29729 RepID=UPI0022F1DA26|nr:acetylserotonin O-methyltransferase-like [Gossypium arboreum]